MKKSKIENVKMEQQSITELPLIDTTSCQPFTKPHVRRSTVKLKDGLKLCPFCARQPEMQQHEGLNCWFVYCKCGLQSPKDSVSKNGAKVIWNRRRFVG